MGSQLRVYIHFMESSNWEMWQGGEGWGLPARFRGGAPGQRGQWYLPLKLKATAALVQQPIVMNIEQQKCIKM